MNNVMDYLDRNTVCGIGADCAILEKKELKNGHAVVLASVGGIVFCATRREGGYFIEEDDSETAARREYAEIVEYARKVGL